MKKIEVMLTDGSFLETLELDVDNGTVDKFGNLIYSFPDGNTFGGHVLLKGFSEVSARSETNVQCDPDPWLLNMPDEEHRKVLPEDLRSLRKVWLDLFMNFITSGHIIMDSDGIKLAASLASKSLAEYENRFGEE